MRIDPLSPSGQALLDAERADGAALLPSADALERVMRKLEVTVAAPVGVGSAGAGAASQAKTASLLAGKLPFGAAMLAVGIGMGAAATLAVQALLRAAPPAPVVVAPAPPAPLPSPEPAIVPAPRPPRPGPRPPPRGEPSTTKAAPSAGDDALVKEQRLLDIARAALVQKRLAAASEALARHQAEYPDGALAEEREFLAVQVLKADGRAAEAEQRERSFRHRYPDSIFLPALDSPP